MSVAVRVPFDLQYAQCIPSLFIKQPATPDLARSATSTSQQLSFQPVELCQLSIIKFRVLNWETSVIHADALHVRVTIVLNNGAWNKESRYQAQERWIRVVQVIKWYSRHQIQVPDDSCASGWDWRSWEMRSQVKYDQASVPSNC